MKSLIDLCNSAEISDNFLIVGSSSVNCGISVIDLAETAVKAVSGHSWNQSIDVPDKIDGNFLALTLKVSPTGDIHRIK